MVAQQVINATEKELTNSFFNELLEHDKSFNNISEDDAVKVYRSGNFNIADDCFGVAAKVSFLMNGEEVHPVFMEFDEIVLVTQFSGFVYRIQKMSEDTWHKSYEGKHAGLNKQELILNMFLLNEDELLIDSTYGNTLTLDTYARLNTLYMTLRQEGLNFEEAIVMVNTEYNSDLLDKEDRKLIELGFPL